MFAPGSTDRKLGTQSGPGSAWALYLEPATQRLDAIAERSELGAGIE